MNSDSDDGGAASATGGDSDGATVGGGGREDKNNRGITTLCDFENTFSDLLIGSWDKNNRGITTLCDFENTFSDLLIGSWTRTNIRNPELEQVQDFRIDLRTPEPKEVQHSQIDLITSELEQAYPRCILPRIRPSVQRLDLVVPRGCILTRTRPGGSLRCTNEDIESQYFHRYIDGAPRRVEKPRCEWTAEDKKKANLDNVAKDIDPGQEHVQHDQDAPGSDQFHEGIDTSMVERLDRRLIRSTTRISTPSPVCTRKPMKISRTESPRRDGRNIFRRWRRAAATTREEGRREEFVE
ncbi:resolvase [Dorcoceras hygrometricum]|uniref:Resolvase n=1 Tax=Dorcoceras hygrometricum TaxID=472368 RepID=A0A2Z7BE25_9LAMI|nr:resolvase [Dorcoceras hygrometricum]